MTDREREEIARRRTFAIISHPDAGKTTLTEKLLLYGGAIHLAGSVKANKSQKKATSDWMEMEKERGISVTSTVLQFEYDGFLINLLDTPGHNDFSADTYRTLTAADCAVMLIDGAKGVETQTRKLFAVCRQRGIPLFTFVNKFDLESMEPLESLSEIEEVLGIESVPFNWPIGMGKRFSGIYDRLTGQVMLFQRVAHGSKKVPTQALPLDDPRIEEFVEPDLLAKLREDIELLDTAATPFDPEKFAAGNQSPVFFGSAITNFGVEPFLQEFLKLAPGPQPRMSDGEAIAPESPFTGFIFKIQANMDPRHRDRIAFMRIVSGRFEKDMQATHGRTAKALRLSRASRLFAQDRETVEEAYAGDIIGLSNVGSFKLGDTLYAETPVAFDEVPSFAPEIFAAIDNRDVSRFKHFDKGVQQLSEEGLVELYIDRRASQRRLILGAVGKLQFDVVQHRLKAEYGVDTRIEALPFETIRWVVGPEEAVAKSRWEPSGLLVSDREHRPAVLIVNERSIDFLARVNEGLTLEFAPPEISNRLKLDREARKATANP